jgi:hypothetical protein
MRQSGRRKGSEQLASDLAVGNFANPSEPTAAIIAFRAERVGPPMTFN